jgi:MFS family permease
MKELQTHNNKILIIASLVTFLGFLDTHLLIPVISLYASSLGAGIGVTGLIIGLYSVANTPANILFGRLIDRTGFKKPLIIGMVGDAVGMFLYSVCRIPLHLAFVRIFHGISGGLIGPSTMSIATDISKEDRKGRTLSFYGMSLAAATLAGYGLGGLIVDWLDYKGVFLFGAGFLLIGSLLSFILPAENKGRINTVNKILPGETLRQMKYLLKKRGLVVSYCSIFAQYFTFGGVVTLLPIYVKSLGMEPFHVGMLLAVFAVVFMLAQYPGGLLSDRAGRLVPVGGALCLGIVSLVILPLFKSFLLLAISMSLYGLAYGLLFPSISALIADYTGTEERGLATGMFHALLTAGVALGAPVLGWMGEWVGVESGISLCAVIMVFPVIIALTSIKRI